MKKIISFLVTFTIAIVSLGFVGTQQAQSCTCVDFDIGSDKSEFIAIRVKITDRSIEEYTISDQENTYSYTKTRKLYRYNLIDNITNSNINFTKPLIQFS